MCVEFDFFLVGEFENFFETFSTISLWSIRGEEGIVPDGFQDFLVGTGFGPQSDSVETFPSIDDNAHHFIISFLLESLADRRKHLP